MAKDAPEYMKLIIKKGTFMLRVLLFLLGIITVIWFLLPFFTKRILNIGNATGIIFGILLMALGIFGPRLLLVGGAMIHGSWWQRFLYKLFFGLLGLAVTTVIVCSVKMYRFATWKPEKNAVALVLGCKTYGDRPSLMLEERLDAALSYLEENPETSCVVSGGKGPDETVSEAEVMQQYLLDKGIDASRIYVENQSTNTRENIAFSSEIIKSQGLGDEVAIVTNEFHEYRAMQIATYNGLIPGAVPGKTALWLFPTYYVRELYSIAYESVRDLL